MNGNLLVHSSRLALLCLLSGLVASVTPARANNLKPEVSEQLENQSDRTLINNANADAEFITDKNEPILLSQSMEQVTSVSQLSDVQPTDWAFQALQSLVERYGCIAGYPDGTYRGNRALTR